MLIEVDQCGAAGRRSMISAAVMLDSSTWPQPRRRGQVAHCASAAWSRW